jgi:hypothetical protein
MTSQLYDLDVPDELSELDLRDADRREIISACYGAWRDSCDQLPIYDYTFQLRDAVYGKAVRMMGPIARKVGGTLTEADFSAVTSTPAPYKVKSDNHAFDVRGIYISAVLNECPAETLRWGGSDPVMNFIGYGLKRGKTVEILKGAEVLYSDERAAGGTVINHGKTFSVGMFAHDGVFLNLGHAAHIASSAKGGTALNLGTVEGFAEGAEGGVFYSVEQEKDHAVGLSMLGSYYTKKDKKLSGLMDVIKTAAGRSDIAEVNRLAAEINGHIRAKYYPLKVVTRSDSRGEHTYVLPRGRKIDEPRRVA